MEMKKYKFISASEYCVRVFDGTHDSPKPCEKGYKLLTSKNILAGELDKESAYYISENDYNAINQRSKIHQYDILFSMIGSVGNVCFVKDKNIDFAIKNMGVFSCEDKEKSLYLYYYLQSPFAKKMIDGYLNGAVQKFLGLERLRNFPIKVLSLQTQQKIAAVLSSLDDKIALNKKINAKLEAMAKRLYDYWFVQFDYPDKNGKPYKTSGGKMVWNEVVKREIPEDWEVGKIGDFVEIGNGKDHSHLKDGNIPVYGSGGFMRSVTDYLFEGESVLFPRKGTLNNIMYKNERFWTVDTMFYSKMKLPHSAIYVYYTTKQFDFSSMNTGTGVPSMTSVIIRGLPIIQPFQQILDKFDNIVQGFYKQIHKNEKETAKLTNLRDRLLPLLMNGQVEVGTNNSSEFCNAKLGKQATACDMNGQVEVVEE